MPPGRPSAKAQPTRKEDLLRLATELFSEHGYEGTSVRMIADRMGILSGSLYSHVSSKEDLLRDIALRVGEEFLARGEAAAAAADTPEEVLRGICRAHVRVLQDHQTEVTVYYNEWRRLGEGDREQIIELRRRYEALVSGAIEDGMRAGDFAVADVRAAVLVVLSALNWTYQWYRRDGRRSAEHIADGYLDVILNGLLRRD